MTKPWEETWEAKGRDVLLPDRNGGMCVIAKYRELDIPPREHANAKLIAAAPEMARLLLELEWAGEEARYRCPTCEATAHPEHAPDCRWLAVMRKAGVRE